jgi:hypothetical protein
MPVFSFSPYSLSDMITRMSAPKWTILLQLYINIMVLKATETNGLLEAPCSQQYANGGQANS